jgi:hypothetical protein
MRFFTVGLFIYKKSPAIAAKASNFPKYSRSLPPPPTIKGTVQRKVTGMENGINP